jgi:hypothetical protein
VCRLEAGKKKARMACLRKPSAPMRFAVLVVGF